MLSRSLWDPLEVGTQRDLFVVWGINVRNLQSSWSAPTAKSTEVHARPRSPESELCLDIWNT